MRFWCQVVLLSLLAASMLSHLYEAVEGRPDKEPRGFSGVVLVLVAVIISFTLSYFAGAYSEIFKP